MILVKVMGLVAQTHQVIQPEPDNRFGFLVLRLFGFALVIASLFLFRGTLRTDSKVGVVWRLFAGTMTGFMGLSAIYAGFVHV